MSGSEVLILLFPFFYPPIESWNIFPLGSFFFLGMSDDPRTVTLNPVSFPVHVPPSYQSSLSVNGFSGKAFGTKIILF